MKRGQGTTMSLEEFIKLAMSIFLAGVLLTIIATVYLWWASPQISERASSLNAYEELIDLIEAKGDDDWETQTFIFLGFGSYIEGFNEGEGTASNSDFERPSKCEGTCICLYQQDLEDDQGEAYPISCSTIDAEGIILKGVPKPVCDSYHVSRANDRISVIIDESCHREGGVLDKILTTAWKYVNS